MMRGLELGMDLDDRIAVCWSIGTGFTLGMHRICVFGMGVQRLVHERGVLGIHSFSWWAGFLNITRIEYSLSPAESG